MKNKSDGITGFDKVDAERYLIEEAKCGSTDTVIFHGHLAGTVVAAVRYKKGNESLWLYCSDFEGIPDFRVHHSPSEFCIVEESGYERRHDTIDRADQNRHFNSELGRTDSGMSDSGQTVKEWCKENGIPVGTYE